MSSQVGTISQDFYLLKVAYGEGTRFGHLALVYTPLMSQSGVLVTATLASDWGEHASDTLLSALPALVEIMETLAPDDRPRCWVLRDAEGEFDFVVRTGHDTYQTAPVVPLRPGCKPRSLAALQDYFAAEAHEVVRCLEINLPRL